MNTTIFKIEGMHCDGCAEPIKALVENNRVLRWRMSRIRREKRVCFLTRTLRRGIN